MITRLICCCLVGTLCVVAQPPSAGSLATINGIVNTEDHTPVSVMVRAARVSPLPAVTERVRSAPNGTFQLPNLLPGTYEICAGPAGDAFLNSCIWDTAPRVTVSATQVAGPVTLTLKKASTLRIHIIDPHKQIGGAPHQNIMMGVLTPGGRYFPVTPKTPDGNGDNAGNNYEILTLFDTTFTFTIHPVGLDLEDVHKTPVGDGQEITLRQDSKAPPLHVLVYRVVAVKGKK